MNKKLQEANLSKPSDTRPLDITKDTILLWDLRIKSNQTFTNFIKLAEKNNVDLFVEVLYAGFWLEEKLAKENCPEDMFDKLMYDAGYMSASQDVWYAHQAVLDSFLKYKKSIAN